MTPAARLAPLPLLLLLLAGCGADDPAVAEAQEVTAREIGPIVGSDQVKVSRVLSRRGISCVDMYGARADRAGTQFLLLCADGPTAEMRADHTHPDWTVYSLWLDTQEVLQGNHTKHCAPVPSSRDVCDKL